MANFAAIAPTLESVLSNEIALARSNQGIWEWYNALSRIMSAQRFTGTVRFDGPVAIGNTDRDVEANAVRVFGILIDNPNASEDTLVGLFNNNTVTIGTTDPLGGWLFGPRNAVLGYVYSNGLALDTAFSVATTLGTQAGIEAAAANTTNPNILCVYTE